MQMPTDKLDFIRHTFGDKISKGKGCLLDCLYQIVQVYVDPSKNLCRLNVTNWNQLEDMNVRQLSYQYYRQQKLTNIAQQENLKYLGKTPHVKQIIGGASQKQAVVFQGSMKQATDRKNIVFKQPSTKLAKKHATTTSVVENHP